ncbi:hypothetical protein ANOM_006779 [Aspergillus nomiae NRRL 13137]|uniref:Cyanovirin-N domain-containing protein n=1 Tax=Aspergillus nomiae NRRL (strain ATCC 15546 / NRRL 13137 / CBS 260.88 / M93) TaxID=1509407 RepID=A0A0L1IZR0_ASPN3|nr:uncharacterized protein ANOM_006779 [Aspergillus nomiae NRRL 13137]KNG84967.1 hypothetical protein ANOM_006779 [Aspergillus nomiae NRRL 13137]
MFRPLILIALYLSALAVGIGLGPGSQAGSSGTGARENTYQIPVSSTRQIHDQCVGVQILPAININAEPPEPNRGGANRAAQPALNVAVPDTRYGNLEPSTGEPPVPPNSPIKREPVPPANVPPASNLNQATGNSNVPPALPPIRLFGNCRAAGGYARPTEVGLDTYLGWDTVSESLIALPNGQGLARGGCWGCQYLRISQDRYRIDCWCDNVVQRPLEYVARGSQRRAARISFNQDEVFQLVNGQLTCPQPRS